MNPFDDYTGLDDEREGEVTCKRCGEDGLEWFYTGVRWRLIDDEGNFHVCNNDNAVDDFEVLE